MENKINLVELLKDCPNGMELDCTLCDDIVFERIVFSSNYPIAIKKLKTNTTIYLTKYGQYLNQEGYKCTIFPKGKTSWEGFVLPCEFKDGDILATDLGSIFYLNTRLNTDECYGCYVGIGGGLFHICEPFAYKECCRFATEEEKAILFDAIKANGYKWDEGTKTLDKLIKPKFKVGDRIKKNKDYISGIVTNISDDDTYKVEYQGGVSYVSVAYQDEWEPVSNKFDINTLVPFESRVLVREDNTEKWKPNFWGFYDIDSAMCYPYECCGSSYAQCIPYEGNEYLLGKTDGCNEYFKTWK